MTNNHFNALECITMKKNERRNIIKQLKRQYDNNLVSLFELNNACNDGIITDEEYDIIIG